MDNATQTRRRRMPAGTTMETTEDEVLTPRRPEKPGAAERIAPTRVVIEAPKLQTIAVTIIGTTQYVQNRFSAKAKAKMEATQRQGSTAKARKARAPREFEADYKACMYRSTEGWHGLPATAIKSALVGACRLTDAPMTLAKISLFVETDGLDATDGTELVRIEGKPVQRKDPVRRGMTTDIAVRASFMPWKAKVRITFDSERFQLSDVLNLLMRAGAQVGVGEGRPASRSSVGMGWGRFSVETRGVTK